MSTCKACLLLTLPHNNNAHGGLWPFFASNCCCSRGGATHICVIKEQVVRHTHGSMQSDDGTAHHHSTHHHSAHTAKHTGQQQPLAGPGALKTWMSQAWQLSTTLAQRTWSAESERLLRPGIPTKPPRHPARHNMAAHVLPYMSVTSAACTSHQHSLISHAAAARPTSGLPVLAVAVSCCCLMQWWLCWHMICRVQCAVASPAEEEDHQE